MTTRVAEGGGGEYGACHYTLAGGVRVPRNLYFSPFAFPFRSLSSIRRQLFLPVSFSLSFFFRRPPSSSSRSFAARFYGFSVLQKVPVLLSLRRCFSSFYHHVLRSTTRDRRRGLILKISLSLLGFLTDLASASRRDRFRSSRACHSSALRDYNDAPPRPRRAGMITRNRLRDPCIHNVYAARSGYSCSPIRVANESLGNDKRVNRAVATSLQ